MDQLIEQFSKLLNKGFEKFGRYYSVYRAIVANREDPDGIQRLKLIVPEVWGDGISPFWVLPESVFSGENFGTQAIPQKGQMINVVFEYGNPQRPRWKHGYFGKTTDGKTEITESRLKDYDSYWFRTPEGLMIYMKEDPEDKDNNLILIEHSNGNALQVDKSGVSFKCEEGLVNLGSFEESSEFTILGETWKEKQSSLLDHIMSLTVSTAFGPSSIPINIADFVDDKANLEIQLSSKVKVD